MLVAMFNTNQVNTDFEPALSTNERVCFVAILMSERAVATFCRSCKRISYNNILNQFKIYRCNLATCILQHYTYCLPF